MTTITPYADAARLAVKRVRRAMSKQVAKGEVTAFEVSLIGDILETTMLATAELLDHGIPAEWILPRVGNALASAARTIGASLGPAAGMDVNEATDRILSVATDSVAAHAANPTSMVSVAVEDPTGGSA